MDEVADRLDAAPSRRRPAEEIPCRLGQPIGLAVAASQQKQQRFLRQVGHRKLSGLGHDDVGCPGIVDERIGRDPRSTLRRDDSGAPVAEAVAVRCDRNRRVEHEIVATHEIGHSCEVHVQVEYHRGWLRTVVDHLEADADLHRGSPGRVDRCARLTSATRSARRTRAARLRSIPGRAT
jgi:hypothetical protein